MNSATKHICGGCAQDLGAIVQREDTTKLPVNIPHIHDDYGRLARFPVNNRVVHQPLLTADLGHVTAFQSDWQGIACRNERRKGKEESLRHAAQRSISMLDRH